MAVALSSVSLSFSGVGNVGLGCPGLDRYGDTATRQAVVFAANAFGIIENLYFWLVGTPGGALPGALIRFKWGVGGAAVRETDR